MEIKFQITLTICFALKRVHQSVKTGFDSPRFKGVGTEVHKASRDSSQEPRSIIHRGERSEFSFSACFPGWAVVDMWWWSWSTLGFCFSGAGVVSAVVFSAPQTAPCAAPQGGLTRSGLNWTGLDFTGLDWIGPAQHRLAALPHPDPSGRAFSLACKAC